MARKRKFGAGEVRARDRKCRETQVFVDALRECLGLRPLYSAEFESNHVVGIWAWPEDTRNPSVPWRAEFTPARRRW